MQTSTTSIQPRKILWVAPLASLVAASLNTILYFIGTATGLFLDSVITPSGGPIGLQEIIMMSIMPALVAGLVFFLLVRFTRNPVRIITLLAVVVLAGMFFTPFSLPGISTGMIVLLEIMHLVVAAVVVSFLTRLTR